MLLEGFLFVFEFIDHVNVLRFWKLHSHKVIVAGPNEGVIYSGLSESER